MDLMRILDLDLELALEITRDYGLNNFDHCSAEVISDNVTTR